jgi:iron complex transport system substrate-binding protein
MLSNRRSSFAAALLFAAASALVFSAPAFASPAASGFTVTDALGRKVEFKAPPTRIAVTGKALFMIADAIYLFPEAGSRIVALGNTAQGKYSFAKALDPRFAEKIALDNNAGAEQIAVANPDAVILKSSMAGSIGKAVETLGIPVVYIDFETPEQYVRDIGTLGAIFQNEARAKQLVAAFQARVDRVAKALAGIGEGQKPRTLVLYYNEQGGAVSFNVPPLGWMQSTQVRLAGGRAAWEGAQLGQGWTKVSIEQIASWDPDQVYVIAYTVKPEEVVAKLKADPQWAGLSAVKKSAIYAFAGDYYSWDQPDPRWILGVDWLAAKLHPDKFQGFDMKADIKSFYRDFYAMDDAAFKATIEPYIGSALR